MLSAVDLIGCIITPLKLFFTTISVNGVFEKHFSERLKEEGCHGNGVKRNTRWSSSIAIQALDVKKKGKGEILCDSNERQAKPKTKTLKNGAHLDAVLKVYCTHIEPDYSLPWQKQKQSASTGSVFVIGDKKLLTNAHCVEHGTQVKVKKKGDDRKYIATACIQVIGLCRFLAIGVDCDLALLSVDNEEFWDDVVPVVSCHNFRTGIDWHLAGLGYRGGISNWWGYYFCDKGSGITN
ncbi:hypothetical protein Drorol1_Dr00014584 [Drosera rotundifolia]